MVRFLLQTAAPRHDIPWSFVSNSDSDTDLPSFDSLFGRHGYGFPYNPNDQADTSFIGSFFRTMQIQEVASIVLPLVTLAVYAVGFYLCYSRIGKAIARLQPPVASTPAQSLPMQVQQAEVYTPTMERILHEAKRPIRFTAEQLGDFTSNYSTRLGYGGFGEVYKGQFPDGEKIAVKVLKRSLDGYAERQLMAEIGTMGRTYHINVVRLYGFCFDYHMRALVYEFMENGSLDKYLFCETEAIKWEKLHDIAVGTARGIAYLHEECDERIIHYDIKPGNILLDSKFSAKVADFGLAKLINRENTHDSNTAYRGTPGYTAPEFLLKNYSITHKCDVYSFGMVLFEVVGRRSNTMPNSTDSINWFPKHVWDEYEKGKLGEMTVACRIDKKDREKAERMAMVALWCVQDLPESRPPMSAVVKMLEGGVEILPPPKPFHYLHSVGMDIIRQASNGSRSETCEATSSMWYKKTTPIMAKNEIQMASS